MSQKIQFGLIVCIALAVALMWARSSKEPAPPAPVIQEIQITQAEDRSVTVYGKGEIKVKPDLMEFEILIQTTDKELDPAKAENDRILEEAQSIFEKYKISSEDVKTDILGIATDATTTRVYSYTTSRRIKVTLRDLTVIEALFTDLLHADVFQIGRISFQVSNLEFYKSQALREAIQSATEKAEIMAGEVGKTIGEPLTIEESPVDFYGVRYSDVIELSGHNLDYIFDDLT
ncbi:MAG: SIMPL domain-containing protein, partial [Chloroflexota bacterium]